MAILVALLKSGGDEVAEFVAVAANVVCGRVLPPDGARRGRDPMDEVALCLTETYLA